jgi:bifunctional non-homologous end joining protein LigD
VRLWSRNGIDVTSRYAVLLPALQKIHGSCVIDGEICALDAQGRSRFQLLQNALNKKAKLLYVVFDALFVEGKDIRDKPLLERKEILKALFPIRYCVRGAAGWATGLTLLPSTTVTGGLTIT